MQLPDIEASETHPFSVQDVKIFPVDLEHTVSKGNFHRLYSVKVTFSNPRASHELNDKYPNHLFSYRVYEVTSGEAYCVSGNIISGNNFLVHHLEETKHYFIRILTLTTFQASEDHSILKFFINHYPSIPAIQLQTLMKLPNLTYSLALNLDTTTSRNEIKSIQFIVEKNNEIIEAKYFDKNITRINFNVAFKYMAEYVIRVYTVFKNKPGLRSQNSNRIFFQFSKNMSYPVEHSPRGRQLQYPQKSKQQKNHTLDGSKINTINNEELKIDKSDDINKDYDLLNISVNNLSEGLDDKKNNAYEVILKLSGIVTTMQVDTDMICTIISYFVSNKVGIKNIKKSHIKLTDYDGNTIKVLGIAHIDVNY
ncbi:unnamed protein product [Gordionus sp. m RMFG-2023]